LGIVQKYGYVEPVKSFQGFKDAFKDWEQVKSIYLFS
jgi:hypothetical protein